MRARAGIAVFLAAGAWAAVVDRIAVTVGKDVITETEVMEEIRVTALLNGDPPDFSPEARRQAAERLVDQHLIRREMEIGAYPEPQENEIEAILQRLKDQQFQGESAYKAALERYGVTEPDLKAHLKSQVAAMRFTDQRFQAAGMPPPTGQEPASQTGSAERAAPEAGSSGQSPRTFRANRAARPRNVDEAMDEWLREARNRTRVVFMKEAFQ